MANTLSNRGLIPVSKVDGSPFNDAIRCFYHDSGNAVAIFPGDLVTQTGGSTIVSTLGGLILPNVVQGAVGDVFSGVCVGVMADTRDSLTYCAASTARVILVNTDPNAMYETNDVGTGTPLTANDIGLNVSVVVGSGSTVTGLSAMALDNTTEATTNTLDLKIIGMPTRADNDPGSSVSSGSAGARFYVRINRHRYGNQIAGI